MSPNYILGMWDVCYDEMISFHNIFTYCRLDLRQFIQLFYFLLSVLVSTRCQNIPDFLTSFSKVIFRKKIYESVVQIRISHFIKTGTELHPKPYTDPEPCI